MPESFGSDDPSMKVIFVWLYGQTEKERVFLGFSRV